MTDANAAAKDVDTIREALDDVSDAVDRLSLAIEASAPQAPLLARLVDRVRATTAQLDVEIPPLSSERARMNTPRRTATFDHVGIAVSDLRAVGEVFEHLGGCLVSGGDNEDLSLRTLQYDFGGHMVELLCATSPNDLARFLERRGDGVHHLTFLVDDVAAEANRLKAAGIDVRGVDLDSESWRECYVMPRDAGGVLVQLVQTSLDRSERRAGVTLEEVLSGQWGWRGARPVRLDTRTSGARAGEA